MEKLITFETAKLLKEKNIIINTGNYFLTEFGKVIEVNQSIKNPLFGKYKDSIYNRPFKSELQVFLYEKYDIWVEVSLNFTPDTEKEFGFRFTLHTQCKSLDTCTFMGVSKICDVHKTPWEALETGLQEALKLIDK